MIRRLLALLLVLSGASYGIAQSVVGNAAAPTINITISPTVVSLAAGVSQQFIGTIANDFNSKGLTWTLTGPSCSGATCGTITPQISINGVSTTLSLSAVAVTYTAPAAVPTIPTVIVTATSVQDATKFVVATVTLTTNPPPIQPNNVQALTSQTAAAVNIFPITATAGNSIGAWPTAPTADTISGVYACTASAATPSTNAACTSLVQKDSASNSTGAFNLYAYTGLGISAGQQFIEVTNSVPSGTIGLAYADITNASVFDTSAHSNNQSGTNPSGPSITPANVQEFVASVVATTGTVSAVASPFTLSNGSAGFGLAEATVINTTSGAISPSYTATTGNWAAITLALKPAASSGAPISVALTPASPTLQTSGTQSFTCTVANDTANAGCSITYTGTGCTGSACGTGPSTAASNAPFTYTAPASVPGSGGSALTMIQRSELNCSPLNGPACTMSVSATKGGATDLQCVTVSYGSAAATVTFSDNATGGSQTYTSANTGTQYQKSCVYGGAAGVTQVSASISTTPNLVDMYYEEYTGVSSGTPDKTLFATQAPDTTNCSSGATTTTSQANNLLTGYCANGGATAYTNGTDGHGNTYTGTLIGGYNGSVTQYFLPTAATQTEASQITANVGSAGFAALEVFKGSAGGGSATPVQVTATSVTDPTKSATAVVTIQTAAAPISVSVAPTSASVTIGTTQAFTPTILHDSGSNTVTWTLTQSGTACSPACGSISPTTTASGAATTYTAPAVVPAPASVTLTATDVTNTAISTSISISVINPAGPFACVLPNCPAFPAIPGIPNSQAAGGGATSAGGRGGGVYLVTNTNDSGSGSLRNCVTDANGIGPRTCVFRVAGVFNITSGDDEATVPFLTIACQTAPGEVIIGGPNSNGVALRISTHDVIVRFCTFSVDNIATVSGPDTGTAGITITNCPQPAGSKTTYPYSPNTGCYNIITDHVTTRWSGNKSWITTSNFTPGVNGNGTGDGPNHNITVQWHLDYEPHEGHPVGYGTATDESCTGTISGPCLSPLEVNIDFHHSMFVNVQHRIPENSNGSSRWIDNIIYNWGFYANEWLGAEIIDDINNKFITGNLNNGQAGPGGCGGFECDGPSQTAPIHFTTNSPELQGAPSVYVAGNIVGPPGTTTVLSNQYATSLVQQISGENGNEQGAIPNGWIRSSPQAASNAYPIPVDPAVNLDAVLLSNVGNYAHLDCNGNWVNHQDQSDARIIAQYKNGGIGGYWPNGVSYTGQSTIPTPTSQWTDVPVINGTACTESQSDGIPDAWKTANGLPTNTPINNRISTHTGLTMLETYMDGYKP